MSGCVMPRQENVLPLKKSEITEPPRQFIINENTIEELSLGSRAAACDYRQVLPQLLKQIGSNADIYPSENYYYFSFNRAGSLFSGSLRLSSDRRDKGQLDYICYESYRSWIEAGSEIHVYKHLSSDDGVSIERLSAHTYRVSYGEAQTIFSLYQPDHISPGSRLSPSETRVGRTLDESGSAFELIFNSKLNNFYFLLDQQLLDSQISVPDHLIRSAPNTLISRRTGFVYYQSTNNKRYVLVAINQQESLLNSMFDGPSDHLPENSYSRLKFWDYVYQVYPGLVGKHTPGGTVNAQGDIFSLMPYRLYDQTSELDFIEACAHRHHTENDKINCMIWGQ